MAYEGKDGKLLNAIEIEYWRCAAGRSKREYVRNETIREVMGVTNMLVDDVKTKQLIRYSHVQRTGFERLLSNVLEWRTPERR